MSASTLLNTYYFFSTLHYGGARSVISGGVGGFDREGITVQQGKANGSANSYYIRKSPDDLRLVNFRE